jgi:hypothetical protein
VSFEFNVLLLLDATNLMAGLLAKELQGLKVPFRAPQTLVPCAPQMAA